MRHYRGIETRGTGNLKVRLALDEIDAYLRDVARAIGTASQGSTPSDVVNDAQFLTLAPHPGLASERRIVLASPLSGTDAGPGRTFTISILTSALTPQALGTAAPGTTGEVSDAGHVHPIGDLVTGPASSVVDSIPTFSNTSGDIQDPNTCFISGNNLVIGRGAAGVDYGLRFDGESSDADLVWLEDEQSLNLRVRGAAQFDYPGYTSGLVINTVASTTLDGFAAWALLNSGASFPYGFFGGIRDESTTAPATLDSCVGAAGYNYLAATNARTYSEIIGGQFGTQYAGMNLTASRAVGAQVGAFLFTTAPTGGGDYIGLEVTDPGGSSTRNIGIRIPSLTGGTTTVALDASNEIHLALTSRLGFGGAALGTGTHGIAFASVGGSRLSFDISGTATYRMEAAAFAPQTTGLAGLGSAARGWLDLWLKDTSAAFEDRIVFTSSVALTADRTVTVDVVNGSRTLKIQGNPTLDNWFDQSVKTTDLVTHSGIATSDTLIPLRMTSSGGGRVDIGPASEGSVARISIGHGGSNRAFNVLGDTSVNQNLLTSSSPSFAGLSISDAGNIVLATTTGTKIGTGTTQKLGFWNATPIVQPSSTGETTGFTANTSANALFNESTWTGNVGSTAYTISDIVKHLKNAGLLAP